MTQPPQDRPDYPWGPSTGSTPPVPPAETEQQPAAEATTELPRPDLTKATPTSGGASAWQPPSQEPAHQDAAFASTPDPSRDQPPAGPSYGEQQPSGPAHGDQAPQGQQPQQPYQGQPYTGQAPQGYVQQGYASGYAGQPSPYYGGGSGVAPAGGTVPTSTIVLLVVSAIILLSTFWTFVGLVWVAPVVLAIVAMVRAGRDLASAKKLTRIGWWVTIGLAVLTVLAIVAFIVFIAAIGAGSGSYSDSGYDSDWGTDFSGLTTSAAYLRALVA